MLHSLTTTSPWKKKVANFFFVLAPETIYMYVIYKQPSTGSWFIIVLQDFLETSRKLMTFTQFDEDTNIVSIQLYTKALHPNTNLQY